MSTIDDKIILSRKDTYEGTTREIIGDEPRLIDLAPQVSHGLWEGKDVEIQTIFPDSEVSFTLSPLYQRGKGLIAKVIGDKQPIYTKNFLNVRESTQIYLYFPQPHDAAAFAASSKYLKRFGPSMFFPGVVGVLNFSDREDYFRLFYLQGCFSERKTPELSRSKAHKYGGWKVHLINEMVEVAENRPIALYHDMHNHDNIVKELKKKGFREGGTGFSGIFFRPNLRGWGQYGKHILK